MNVEMHRADPRLRRLTLAVLGIALIAAVLSISMFHRWLDRFTETMPLAQLVVDRSRLTRAGAGRWRDRRSTRRSYSGCGSYCHQHANRDQPNHDF